jgi:hypothetical protein
MTSGQDIHAAHLRFGGSNEFSASHLRIIASFTLFHIIACTSDTSYFNLHNVIN